LDVTNANEIFSPYKSTQYEIGGKAKIGPMFVGLALYQIKKPNAYSIDLTPDDGQDILTHGLRRPGRTKSLRVK
jgi:iron complex outermembrane receptor protein